MKSRKWLVAGLLILAEVGLCAGIILVLWTSIGLARASGVRLNFFSVDTVSAQADEEQRFEVNTPAALDLQNTNGKITVTGGAGSEIVVTAHKTAWGSSQADADANLAALKVSVTQTGNTITARVEQPSEILVVGSSRSDSVDFTITVPGATAVTASTNFGDVRVTGLTDNVDVDLHSSFGDVTVEEVAAGEVSADSNSGAVSLKGVQAGGSAKLSSDFGAIKFKNGSAASLGVETNSGAVELTDLKVSGSLAAQSDFGGVTLEQVDAASYDLRTNSGAIVVTGARGSLKAHSDFGNVEVTDAEDVQLDLSTNSGSIKFAGSLGDGPHKLKTDFGGVRLALPKDAALDIDLKTDFGALNSDLPVTISGSSDPTHWRGTINGGGPSLTASTNNGDILLTVLNP